MKDSKDQDVLAGIVNSPMPNNEGVTNQIDLEDNEQREEERMKKEDFISLVFNNKTVSDKYKKDLVDQAAKDPRSVQVKTPEGWMTVKEAIEAGYDPATGEFSKPGIPPINADKALEGMNPEDAEKLKGLMDPKNVQIPRGQMKERGIKDNMFGALGKPIPKKEPGQAPVEGEDPNMIPTEGDEPAMPDLANILGGGGING